jgi:hypothetical protein
LIVDELSATYGFDVHIEIPDQSFWASYTSIVQVDTRFPLLNGLDEDLEMAVVFHDIKHLAHLDKFTGKADLVFAPEAPDCLDLLANNRMTLMAARSIEVGTILSSSDIGTEIGGSGILADKSHLVVGKAALYNLSAGAPLDFGIFE